MKLTKQTSLGELVIEISNGTARATVNGQAKCSSGMVHTLNKPVTKSGVTYTATLCTFGLTADEAKQCSDALKVRDFTPAVGTGRPQHSQHSHSFTAQVNRDGNINKWMKCGA